LKNNFEKHIFVENIDLDLKYKSRQILQYLGTK